MVGPRPALAAPLLAAPLAALAGPACAARPAVAPAAERGVFLFVAGGDTTLRDAYTRTPAALEGEARVLVPEAKFERARYRVAFDPAGRAWRADLAFLRAGAARGAPPLARFTAALHPDGRVEEARDGGPPSVAARLGPGAVPWFPPSVAMLQEVVRRARHLTGGRGRAAVPVFPLASGGQGIDTAIVMWVTPDSVDVSFRDGTGGARYAVDARGRVLGGRSHDGTYTTVRLR